jgi:hypothetical protein
MTWAAEYITSISSRGGREGSLKYRTDMRRKVYHRFDM